MTAPSASEHELVFQPITTQAQLDRVLARELAGIRDDYEELQRRAAQVDQGDHDAARGSADARGSGVARGSETMEEPR
jgi:hypothetical protein